MGESGKRGNLADAIELSSSHCLKSTFLIKAISIIHISPFPKLHNLEIKSDLSSKI